MRPDLRIGFFLHIPFPPVELFMQLPRRVEILRGLLGADLVGFQRPLGAQNFLRLTRHLLGLRPRGNVVEVDGREVRADAFPISIDVGEIESLALSPLVRERAERIRVELGEPKTMILGVDRLDYTKGIESRIKAFRELLAEGRLSVPETVMVQVATPSRERVEQYQALRVDVEREVGRINGDFGRVGVPAVHYLHQSYSRSELVALFCAADVMMVTPLRDGMNLVAKEYVAARVDLGGALVLSEFAGAAGDLRQAFLVNPYDLDGVKDTLLQSDQRSTRWTACGACGRCGAILRTHDVSHWAQVVPGRARGTGRSIAAVPQHWWIATVDARARTPRRDRPHRPGAAAARRLRLRRHAGADRRRSVEGGAAAGGGRRAPVAGRAAADHRRGGVRSGAARPGHAVPAAERGASGRLARQRIRRRLRRAARARSWSRCASGSTTALVELADGAPGVRLERKPAIVAVHCAPPRRTSPTSVLDAVRSGPATWPDVYVTHGKQVIELSVIDDAQGHRARRAAHAAVRQRGAVPRRRRHRRERVRRTARPGRRHQDRPGRHRGGVPGRATRSRGVRVLALVLERPAHVAVRRARGPDRAALDAVQPAHRRPGRPGRHDHLAVPPAARTRRRSSPTCSAAPPAGHFTVRAGRPRRPPARASATGPAR